MALPADYAGQLCSLARTLEVVGGRWTMLIIRDAFYGARRFGEFVEHLNLSRAVLTERLNALVAAGVMRHNGRSGKNSEYALTEKGLALWPVVRAMMAWGDEYYAPKGRRRVFLHAADQGEVDESGSCAVCGAVADLAETVVAPGPGLESATARQADVISTGLRDPHLLLSPFGRRRPADR
jgi:DNA-binding HxlR family transcriptional regulator